MKYECLSCNGLQEKEETCKHPESVHYISLQSDGLCVHKVEANAILKKYRAKKLVAPNTIVMIERYLGLEKFLDNHKNTE